MTKEAWISKARELLARYTLTPDVWDDDDSERELAERPDGSDPGDDPSEQVRFLSRTLKDKNFQNFEVATLLQQKPR